MAIMPNIGYLMYQVYGGLFLSVDHSGLHIAWLQATLGWVGSRGFEISVYLLTFGFIINIFRRKNK